MPRSRILTVRAAELALVALVGGAVALGGAALLGKLGSHTTIQQVAPAGGSTGVANAALQAPATGITPEQIYRRDAPGVVQITSTTVSSQQSDPFGFPATPQTVQSLGSGFVIDKTGHIVTNYHVISGATRVQVSFSGQDEINATVVGSDPSTDIAVLKIDTHSRALTPLTLGNSDAVDVGDPVFAIGNPFGFTRTLTAGARLGAPASDRRAEQPPDRRCHPDGRRDQPRQLGRPADRPERPRDRRHVADLDRNDGRAGEHRHRLRDPGQHRAERCGPDHQERQGRPCLPRRQHRLDHARRSRSSSTFRLPRA